MKPARSCEIFMMDYKMKFEPIRFWETSVEFYGKRGIQCHGTVVLFRMEDDEKTVGDDLGTLVFDHSVENENSQDSWAVASIPESFMLGVKNVLPAVSSTWIVTDNAHDYQNDILPVITPVLVASHGVSSNGLIHPETARGKGLVDSHFSLAMGHVHRWIHESWKDLCTARELWSPLNSGEVILVYTTQLVQISLDGPCLHHWRSAMALRPRHLAKLGRVGEINYVEKGMATSILFSTPIKVSRGYDTHSERLSTVERWGAIRLQTRRDYVPASATSTPMMATGTKIWTTVMEQEHANC